MSRSGYTDDCEYLGLWRGAVDRAIKGKRGQQFLKELVQALDEMPEKTLIHGELIDEHGDVCAIGAVCKKRNLDVSNVDIDDPRQVGKLVGISKALAAEIEYINDDDYDSNYFESPERRYQRVRGWVESKIQQ